MEITSNLVNIDDQIFPKPLYKYRHWANPYHKTIVSKRELYFAAPTTFEDELEFRNFKRYDLLNDQEVYDIYFKMSRERRPSKTLSEHSAYAMEWTQKAPFKDPSYLREAQEEQFKRYDERVGVLSLTLRNDNLDMWNYYAGKGDGFCVGFDTHVLAKHLHAGFAPVEYPENGLPIIKGTDNYDLQTWKQAFNKTVRWRFEEEYRFYIFNPHPLSDAQRRLIVPPEAYLEIVIGWKMPPKIVDAVVRCIEDQKLTVRLLTVRVENERVLLKQL